MAIFKATGDGGILIIPMPSFSAMYRSACLAQELKKRGHNVTVVLPGGSAKETLLEEFDFDVIVSEGMKKAFMEVHEIASVIMQSAFNGSKLMGLLKLPRFGQMCYNIAEDETLFKTIQAKNFKLAVINTVFTNLCISVIPYKLGIPFIREEQMPLESGILIHPAVFPVDPFLPTTDKMTYFQRLGNTLLYVVYLLKPDMFSPWDIVGTFAPDKEHITNADLHVKTELYLLDYDELVEYHLPLYPNMIPVGGIATRPPRPLSGELEGFMDSAQDGAVVVSLGSIITWMPVETQDKLVAAFHRFPNLKFVFKLGKETRNDDNVMFTSWIPQNDLLGHHKTKLFITHCGHNAQYDALYNAVPVIALPVYGDQPFNAMTMQAKGFGIKLDVLQITEEDIVSAIDEVLRNPSYKQNISNTSTVFKSRQFTPAQRAAWWIEHVLQYGGNHLRPPVARLPYYQFLLLDMFVGILFLLAILCFTCYAAIRCIFRKCRKTKDKKD